MRRFPESIAATIAVTVIAAMLVGFGVQRLVSSGLVWFAFARQPAIQIEDARFFQQLPGRIAALLDILDATPNADRSGVIAAAQLPRVQIGLAGVTPMATIDVDEPDADFLRRRIEAVLTVPRTVIVADWYWTPPQQAGRDSKRQKIGAVIDVALSDGRWVVFWGRLGTPPAADPLATEFSRAAFTVWLGLSMPLGLLLSFLAVQRLVRPISELVTAVEQLGGSGDATSFAPHGPREVRAAIRAFNRMRERLRRFNEDRTRMIAAMSHDLRTPLTRLRLRAELVEVQDQRPKMLAEIDKMDGMIGSMLTFARDDAKHEPQSLVDLSALVEGICQDASDAGERVTFSGPRGVSMSCRPAVLRRAVSNIVENAVKYGGSASVSLFPEAERIVLVIEDNGPGIPWSERAKVFEPFYRIDRARDPNTGGVGLGLCVARSIVWEHGGDIVLGNRKGGGLSVRVELPVTTSIGLPDQRESTPRNGVRVLSLSAVGQSL